MTIPGQIFTPQAFSARLYAQMKQINPGIGEMELYEFRYALHNLYPEEGGWPSVKLEGKDQIELMVNSSEFYNSIQVKPRVGDQIVLDEKIMWLTNMIFVGLVNGDYPVEWVKAHFFFDIRGFLFLNRTHYFTNTITTHLGGKPFKQFEQKQTQFDRAQSIGYKAFKEANTEVDQQFVEIAKKLIDVKGTPILLAIAGPTAAGKTEIVERLRSWFEQEGKHVTSIEMDNFLTDREYREEKGIHSLGKPAIHFDLFRNSLEDICSGKKITIPRYDFIYATSSHDLGGNLKPGAKSIEIEPADIIFLEGNFPFLIEEVIHLIGVKVVYLTADEIRMKRKWKRDIDYRKKYDPTYFRNRYFKTQFLMAQKCYLPQMAACDVVVDTTGAAIWTTSEVANVMSAG